VADLVSNAVFGAAAIMILVLAWRVARTSTPGVQMRQPTS
jgi:hypothetical protein